MLLNFGGTDPAVAARSCSLLALQTLSRMLSQMIRLWYSRIPFPELVGINESPEWSNDFRWCFSAHSSAHVDWISRSIMRVCSWISIFVGSDGNGAAERCTWIRDGTEEVETARPGICCGIRRTIGAAICCSESTRSHSDTPGAGEKVVRTCCRLWLTLPRGC